MCVIIRVPSSLSHLTNNKKEFEFKTEANIELLLETLDGEYPGIKDKLCDQEGSLFDYVNIYLNGQDVDSLQGMATSLKDGDELDIIPAASGG